MRWEGHDHLLYSRGGENEVITGARLSMAMEFSYFCIYPHFGQATVFGTDRR